MRPIICLVGACTIAYCADGIKIKEVSKIVHEYKESYLVFVKKQHTIARSPKFGGEWKDIPEINRVIIWEVSGDYRGEKIMILDRLGKLIDEKHGYGKIYHFEYLKKEKLFVFFSWCRTSGVDSVTVDVLNQDGTVVVHDACKEAGTRTLTCKDGRVITVEAPTPVVN